MGLSAEWAVLRGLGPGCCVLVISKGLVLGSCVLAVLRGPGPGGCVLAILKGLGPGCREDAILELAAIRMPSSAIRKAVGFHEGCSSCSGKTLHLGVHNVGVKGGATLPGGLDSLSFLCCGVVLVVAALLGAETWQLDSSVQVAPRLGA